MCENKNNSVIITVYLYRIIIPHFYAEYVNKL